MLYRKLLGFVVKKQPTVVKDEVAGYRLVLPYVQAQATWPRRARGAEAANVHNGLRSQTVDTIKVNVLVRIPVGYCGYTVMKV